MIHELNAERIQYIFRNMEDAVCITGMGGELLYANPAAEKLFGLQAGSRPKIWEAIPYV
ncbi:MAG: PAS domain-containing protein, partial [Clostridia bacterium]|nr:PAS domain-containing protein [Clostridia bacterium]